MQMLRQSIGSFILKTHRRVNDDAPFFYSRHRSKLKR